MNHRFNTFLSPAKLNLGLKIIGKRNDGYHLLKSVFCLINLFDEVNIQITNNGKISLIEHQQAWNYKDDLAFRAASLLHDYAKNCTFGANIKINKIIPNGSGMGGGSSNAATTLMVLNKLWGLDLNKTTLMKLGETLGADVPFFIFGENALVSGIGETLEPVTLPDMYFVIVKPSFNIPTKTIFGQYRFDDSIHSEDRLINTEQLISLKKNDLLDVAIRIYPQLKIIINELQQYGNPAMTGSGSAIYLTFNNSDKAKTVFNGLKNKYETFLTQNINECKL